jgi:uncharacterized membrane protein YcaP (DUF421 family)
MDWQQVGMTAARGLLVYVVMLVVIRLLGKRTVGNFTAFDLLVALMLGEVVDEIIYGDVTLAQGFTAIIVVAAAKYATSWLTYGSERLSLLLEGKPTELVKEGELQRDALRSELMNELDVMAALRLQSVSDVREVKSAILEVDGAVSVIREDWAEPVQKGDVLKERQTLPGTPPEEYRTDSPRAIGIGG